MLLSEKKTIILTTETSKENYTIDKYMYFLAKR